MKDFYTEKEAEELGFVKESDLKEDERLKYLLTKKEFDIIRGVFKYWYDQPNFNKKTNGVSDSFEETRTNFINWTYNYLKQFWPKVQYKILEYKKTFEIEVETVYSLKELPIEMYDTVAFKFAKGRPEIYLLVGQYTTIMDEMRFIAYDEPNGKFKRPQWTI